MKLRLFVPVLSAALVGSIFAAPAALAETAGASAKLKTVTRTVCKPGCAFRTIQSAVNASNADDVIKVKPGKYREGVVVEGHKYDGLAIVGTGKSPRAVILEGKNAQSPNGLAQNGVEGIKVDDLRVENLWVRNYVTNGVFIHEDCDGYLMKDLLASFNRAYGLFAFNCKGGRMTKSSAWGSGDSGFYIGQTPKQAKPKWTSLDHLKGYLNVLGYSGTNSRYVNIHDSDFFNNGIGVVPNTLDSENFEPAEKGIVQNNNIFWNNFNYYLPKSPVKSVSSGLGEFLGLTINFPMGAGVVLLGVRGWTIKNNNIFGNFKWGVASISNPFNEGDDAVSRDNRMLNNKMGKGGTDTNAVDFFADGSGSGNCYQGNNSSTFDPSGSASNENLYPSCPAPDPPASGTGTSAANDEQFGDVASYVTADPPSKMECSWTKHAHPGFKGYKPINVPGAECP